MPDASKQKLIDLETSLGLLQHDFEAQNQMLLRALRQIDLLENSVARLVAQLDSMRYDSGRTAQDEKPPHY